MRDRKIEEVKFGGVTLYRVRRGTNVIFAPTLGDPAEQAELEQLREQVMLLRGATEELNKHCEDLETTLSFNRDEVKRVQHTATQALEENEKLKRALAAEQDHAPHLLQLVETYAGRFAKCIDQIQGSIAKRHTDGVDTTTLTAQTRAFLGEWRALKKRLNGEEEPECR